ncbi:hypothetical protein [Aurantimonas sp. A3-2-R12]|uniref:hypothetical protein n=1 Tax=Aurantimonas sp. A3-2-R12 TaxID=3114362 RepID=UPI002E17385B|nr:hypothetical protein [Aurantimonas sp. A3-2-R12]
MKASLAVVLLLALMTSADARSKAAAYLVEEQIARACEDGRGSIDPAGVIERDLDGDGRDDLIIAHEAISCTSGGQFGRSMFCGMQVRSVMFYLAAARCYNSPMKCSAAASRSAEAVSRRFR